MSDAYWKQPYKWNADAAKRGERQRVFCASMADVFEDHPQVVDARRRLFNLILDTPNLDWLLLTKRPENIMDMVPADWRNGFPENVWIGTSVENQEQANKRIPALLDVPASVRFLSCEPLLGAVDLTPWLVFEGQYDKAEWSLANYGASQPISWVIAGGESGHGARPMHPQWARSLRDQCVDAGVAFFFKQWGEYICYSDLHYLPGNGPYGPTVYPWTNNPFDAKQDNTLMIRAGKKVAGRLLDGREWNEFPSQSQKVRGE